MGKSAVKSISPQVPVLPPKSTQIQPSSSLVLPASAPVQTKSTDEPVSASAAEFTRIWSFRDFTFKTTITGKQEGPQNPAQQTVQLRPFLKESSVARSRIDVRMRSKYECNYEIRVQLGINSSSNL